MDVGQDASLSYSNSREKLVQLFVVADGELNVAGSDTLLLVVAARISRQLQDLGAQVLEGKYEKIKTNCFGAIFQSEEGKKAGESGTRAVSVAVFKSAITQAPKLYVWTSGNNAAKNRVLMSQRI